MKYLVRCAFLCMVILAASAITMAQDEEQDDLITNGDFEEQTVIEADNPNAAVVGPAEESGWTIEGSIDWIGTRWEAASGEHSIDLSGSGIGSMSQTVDVEADTTYVLRFALSGNPEREYDQRAMHVLVDEERHDFVFERPSDLDNDNMTWEYHEIVFRTGEEQTSVTITLVSDEDDVAGPLIDDVRMEAGSIYNGSFEDTELDIEEGGSANNQATIAGWEVVEGNVDLSNGRWDAHDGTHSIDMYGNAPGTIQKTVSTVEGSTYRLSFWVAGNPGRQGQMQLQVLIDGETSGDVITFDTTGRSADNMGWEQHTREFVATSSETVIAFEALVGIDDVAGTTLDSITFERLD